MLEESKMDKKFLNRLNQSQSRTSAVDCKKSPGELTNKPWPRNNKKREGPGSVSKNEPSRKNVPSHRGRGQLDRRPRPRGLSDTSLGGTANAGIDDEDPEIGSVFAPGIKKQNFNHLLNFMYPTRRGPERRDHLPHRQNSSRQCHVLHHHEHDLYLRAYCQFVVKEDGDYHENFVDPDVAVKWELIEEIVVRSSGHSECPICLGTPVAARVGLCGHVYCWACVLHYAAANEKQSPPCPVCLTPLSVPKMKPARMLQWKFTNEQVTMKLVRRVKGTTVVEVAPREQAASVATPSVLSMDNMKVSPYSKIFKATKQQVHDILLRDRQEIEKQILDEIDTTEIEYLQQALDMLKEKENKIDFDLDASYVTPESSAKAADKTIPIVYEKINHTHEKFDWFDVTDDGDANVNELKSKVKDLNLDSSQLNPGAAEFNLPDPNDDRTQDAFNVSQSSSDQSENVTEFNISGESSDQTEQFPLADYPPDSEENLDVASFSDIDIQNRAKYFYFYQAEDGALVFLHKLNVRVLTASWGFLAVAPETISGRVLCRESFQVTEQTRKHMPFTSHLPLYCSFDVVELDLQPPHVTHAALRKFAEDLDRRARIRARSERDERRRERAYKRAMEGPPKPDFSSDLVFPPASCPVQIRPTPLAQQIEPSPSCSNMNASPTGISFAKMASTSGTWRVRKPVVVEPPPVPEDDNATPLTLNLSDAIEAALQAPPLTSNKKNKKSKQKVLFTTGMLRSV